MKELQGKMGWITYVEVKWMTVTQKPERINENSNRRNFP